VQCKSQTKNKNKDLTLLDLLIHQKGILGLWSSGPPAEVCSDKGGLWTM